MERMQVPAEPRPALDHLSEYAPPGEKARNQLLLIVSVFGVALGLRLAGVGWPGTLVGAGVGGMAAGMAALALWERATGRRSARAATEDRLGPASATLMGALQADDTPSGAATGAHDDVRWIVSVRTDVHAAPPPDALPDPLPAGAPLPVAGTRYRPVAGAVAVVPGAWVRVEARRGADPISAAPFDARAPGSAVLNDLPPDAHAALVTSGRFKRLAQALRLNQPWPHHLRIWPNGLVVTLPFTDAVTARGLRPLVDALCRWQAARRQAPLDPAPPPRPDAAGVLPTDTEPTGSPP